MKWPKSEEKIKIGRGPSGRRALPIAKVWLRHCSSIFATFVVSRCRERNRTIIALPLRHEVDQCSRTPYQCVDAFATVSVIDLRLVGFAQFWGRVNWWMCTLCPTSFFILSLYCCNINIILRNSFSAFDKLKESYKKYIPRYDNWLQIYLVRARKDH